jgi:hypothetical protein
MNEEGATPKARKPFYFEGVNGANVPVEAVTHSHGNGQAE